MKTSKSQVEFIGRQDAIDVFLSLRSLKSQKNALYLAADGGLGKTSVLHEYIRQCDNQLHPWHVRPKASLKDFDPVIDFYDFQNRSISGLRRSIAERFDPDHFRAFRQRDAELQQAEQKLRIALQSKADVANLHSELINLRSEVEPLFFQDFARTMREMRNYTALFCDTFEIIEKNAVGRWFVDKFLPRSETSGCIIVFAGRSKSLLLPFNVHCYTLGAFNEDEVRTYCEKYFAGLEQDNPILFDYLKQLAEPLLLDLIRYYWFEGSFQGNGGIGNIVGLDKERLKDRLTSQFLDQIDPLHRILHDMAYLKRRYNRSIYEHCCSEERDPLSFDIVEEQLLSYPFVKRRPDQVYALHDILQEMIVKNGRGDWKERADELHELIIHNWYDKAIEDASDEVKSILQVEQLAYLLENNRIEGLTRCRDYLTKIKRFALFDLGDLLWGELERYLTDTSDDYELARAWANWLFEASRFNAAIHIFLRTTGKDFTNAQEAEMLRQDVARLGHCYWRTGNPDVTDQLWTKALDQGRQEQNSWSIAPYSYNLAQIRAQAGQWQNALELFEEAIIHAEIIHDRDLLGQILFVQARLYARNGEYRSALSTLQRGLDLIHYMRPGTLRQAQGFVYAGDVYRYVGDAEAAKRYYELALKILENSPRQDFAWRAEALTGLGASYRLSGTRKRVNHLADVVECIADQLKAFEQLNRALELIRDHNIESLLSLVLRRLANVFLELYELEKLSDDKDKSNSLSRAGITLELIEETKWTYQLREPDVSFRSLDTLGKAQRLSEIAFLQAERMSNIHHMQDALANATRCAQKRNRRSDLDHYLALVNTLRGLNDPNQEKIFFRLLDIFHAHLSFNENIESAINRYSTAFLTLREVGGFGWAEAQKELSEVRERLLGLSRQQVEVYCDMLAKAWRNHSELLTFIKGVQDLF